MAEHGNKKKKQSMAEIFAGRLDIHKKRLAEAAPEPKTETKKKPKRDMSEAAVNRRIELAKGKKKRLATKAGQVTRAEIRARLARGESGLGLDRKKRKQ